MAETANRFQRAFIRFAGSGPGSWLFARAAHRIDRPLYRLTNGRHTFASFLSGLPVVMLTTTGARTGRSRTLPVLGLPTTEGLVVVASNYGQAHHPAWCHNLRANPRGEVSVRGDAWGFEAVEAEGDQRARIWRQGLDIYPAFATYERRASGRRIAIFVLNPASGGSVDSGER